MFNPEYILYNKVCWSHLSLNPNAIPVLEKYVDKVDWTILSRNPNAIPILEKYLDSVKYVKSAYNAKG